MGNKANTLRLIDYLTGQQSSSLGRNYVLNPSAFVNANNVTAANSATVARNTTTPLTQISDFSITMPNNTTGTVTWSLNTLDNSLKNQNCELRFDYTASSIGSNVVVQVLQGSNIAAQSPALATASSSQTVSLNVPCGDISSATTIVLANGSGNSGTSAINLANIVYGKVTNLSISSQAQLVASGYFATTASCTVSRTNTALGAFGTTAACPGPTVETNQGPGVLQTTDVDLPTKFTINNLPAGIYKVTFAGPIKIGTSVQSGALAINDGTTTFGQTGIEYDTASGQQFFVEGIVSYSTAGNRTFELYASSAANAVTIDITAANKQVYFTVTRYPSSGELAFRSDITPASWSGYHDTSATWSRTNVAYGDLTPTGTAVLTERYNRNFGSVTTAASNLPGITFTPPRSGRYLVTVLVANNGGAGGNSYAYRLFDGTNQLTEATSNQTSTGTITLSGIANLTPVSTTLKIQCKASASNCNIASGENELNWTIVELDAAMPTPILVGSVTSNSTGAERIERILIASGANCTSSPCTISSQSGSWVSSVTRNGTGDYTVNIVSGIFSVAPVCAGEHFNGPINVQAVTTTTAFRTATLSPTSPADSRDIHIICMGQR